MASAGTSPLLYPKDLPTEIRAKMARDSVPPPSSSGDTTHRVKESFPQLEAVRAAAIIDTERAYLKDLMAHTGGDIAAAIDLSGLSRARFYALLKKHSIATSIRPK
jgi:two-component system NtrC family response regulator